MNLIFLLASKNRQSLPRAFRTELINNIKDLYIGKCNKICSNCNAVFFKKENMKCCRKGAIKLPLLRKPPKLLKDLFDRNHENSDIFFKHIRLLNSLFGFTSLGEKYINKEVSNSRVGGYTYRVHGSLYHSLGSLLPPDNQQHSFSSLYFYDPQLALLRREEILNRDREVLNSKVLLESIQNCLESNNELIKIYKQKGIETLESPENLMVIKSNNEKIDIRVHNSNDFAVIVPSHDNDLVNPRDVIVKQKDDKLQSIQYFHPISDPLNYVLIYSRGEIGWSIRLFDNRRRKISLRDHTNYYLRVRKNNFNVIFKGGRLFQQWLCNKWIDIESEVLNFLKLNQKKLRVVLYKGLCDAFVNNTDLHDIGKLRILPSSFFGGPRYMQQLYNDAMSIVLSFGKPDLFVTVTCNPDWKEISENLFYGQTSWDRTDLCCTVFNTKFEHLVDDIKNSEIFGEIKAHVWVIEFQIRGLPHAHLLLILKEKLNEPKLIDKCVRAEIPDRDRFPILYDRVIKFMIHSPCDDKTKSFHKCYKNNKCSKHFPKKCQLKTEYGENSYATYRRRRLFKITYKNREISDEFVVPYSPYLLMRYNCHINVEICSGIKATKYLYKYVYKGHDKSTIKITHPFDEIETYIENR